MGIIVQSTWVGGIPAKLAGGRVRVVLRHVLVRLLHLAGNFPFITLFGGKLPITPVVNIYLQN